MPRTMARNGELKNEGTQTQYIDSLLNRRLLRWSNIDPTVYQYLTFAGINSKIWEYFSDIS